MSSKHPGYKVSSRTAWLFHSLAEQNPPLEQEAIPATVTRGRTGSNASLAVLEEQPPKGGN